MAFLVFVGLRVLNPDLWQPWFGGEKMMEIAILNALTKSAYLPPYDPYFAGGYLNYYYYGQFIAAVLIKLTGIVPEVAFNLAVPTFFALTIAHTFGLGYQWAVSHGQGRQPASAESPVSRHGLWAGLSAATLVAVIGNLTAVTQLGEQLARAGGATFEAGFGSLSEWMRLLPGLVNVLSGGAQLPPFDYWYQSTRVIPNTINEFPFFSFLFADLHPHMIGIPFTLVVLALCLALLLDRQPERGRAVLRWLVLAVAVGALGVINTWDLPAYLALLGATLLYQGYRLGRRRGLIEAAISFLALALAALLLYAPFYMHYRAQYGGLALVPPAEWTPISYWLAIWGLFLFLVLSLLGLGLAQSWPGRRLARSAARYGWLVALRRLRAVGGLALPLAVFSLVILALASLVTFWLLWQCLWLLALLVPLLALAGVLVLWSERGPLFWQRLLLFLGLAILIGVELVYLEDWLSSSEWRRMNTVFKFYIQVWVLFGVATGSALPTLWRLVGRVRGMASVAWKGILLLLLGASLLYPLLAIPVRVDERMPSARPPRGTLDGTAYMAVGAYEWPDAGQWIELKYDREALVWLWEHVQGTPVLVEAPLGYYREGGLRISSYTGLPTLVGMHEREQRPWEQVGPQEEDAAALYETTDLNRFREIVARHHVRYIYVGQLEQRLYAGPGLEKFETLVQNGELKRVFHNDRVVLYRVVSD